MPEDMASPFSFLHSIELAVCQPAFLNWQVLLLIFLINQKYGLTHFRIEERRIKEYLNLQQDWEKYLILWLVAHIGFFNYYFLIV